MVPNVLWRHYGASAHAATAVLPRGWNFVGESGGIARGTLCFRLFLVERTTYAVDSLPPVPGATAVVLCMLAKDQTVSDKVCPSWQRTVKGFTFNPLA